jgi:hypothetical protein
VKTITIKSHANYSQSMKLPDPLGKPTNFPKQLQPQTLNHKLFQPFAPDLSHSERQRGSLRARSKAPTRMNQSHHKSGPSQNSRCLGHLQRARFILLFEVVCFDPFGSNWDIKMRHVQMDRGSNQTGRRIYCSRHRHTTYNARDKAPDAKFWRPIVLLLDFGCARGPMFPADDSRMAK